MAGIPRTRRGHVDWCANACHRHSSLARRVVSAPGGVSVLVDQVSFEFLKGAKVDYSEELIRASFQARTGRFQQHRLPPRLQFPPYTLSTALQLYSCHARAPLWHFQSVPTNCLRQILSECMYAAAEGCVLCRSSTTRMPRSRAVAELRSRLQHLNEPGSSNSSTNLAGVSPAQEHSSVLRLISGS